MMCGEGLTDGDLVGGGVGADPEVLYRHSEKVFVFRFGFSLTAVGQVSLAAIGDESESTGETGSADSANEGSNGGERELHIEQEVVIKR